MPTWRQVVAVTKDSFSAGLLVLLGLGLCLAQWQVDCFRQVCLFKLIVNIRVSLLEFTYFEAGSGEQFSIVRELESETAKDFSLVGLIKRSKLWFFGVMVRRLRQIGVSFFNKDSYYYSLLVKFTAKFVCLNSDKGENYTKMLNLKHSINGTKSKVLLILKKIELK